MSWRSQRLSNLRNRCAIVEQFRDLSFLKKESLKVNLFYLLNNFRRCWIRRRSASTRWLRKTSSDMTWRCQIMSHQKESSSVAARNESTWKTRMHRSDRYQHSSGSATTRGRKSKRLTPSMASETLRKSSAESGPTVFLRRRESTRLWLTKTNKDMSA